MRTLGAILGGGQSRRFGSDKALALIDGVPLLDHVATGLRTQTEAVVVVGRDWPGLERVNDVPRSGMGPMGGIAGALDYAARHGFDQVLISPCDMPDVPHDLLARLSPAPAYIDGQQAWSLWPVTLAAPLRAWLDNGGSLRVMDWARHTNARPVTIGHQVRNINYPTDM